MPVGYMKAGLLAVGGVVLGVGVILTVTALDSGEAQAHDGGEAEADAQGLHDTVISYEVGAPTVAGGYSMQLEPVPDTNYVQVLVTGPERFQWIMPTPTTRHVEGYGWAVLEMEGTRLGTLHSPSFGISHAPPGRHEVVVRLMQGDGSPYEVDGVPLIGTATLIATAR